MLKHVIFSQKGKAPQALFSIGERPLENLFQARIGQGLEHQNLGAGQKR